MPFSCNFSPSRELSTQSRTFILGIITKAQVVKTFSPLQKLIDQRDQTTIGGRTLSHPTLAQQELNEFGVTDKEINQLGYEDSPDRFS